MAKKTVKEKVKPKAKHKAKIEQKVRAPKKAKPGLTVLSIDDEEVIRALLEKILLKAGYDVKLAASGEEGLKAMKKEAFDLCIIDLKMPGMGGMAFLEQMKERYPDTEAVILTAFGDIDTAVDAMKKGAFNFVSKPFKKNTFLTVIERALERKTMKKELQETRTTMHEIEDKTSRKIGELESQLEAVEEAKKELGEEFKGIKQSLMDKSKKRGDLEKKVLTLERVAGQIKEMEEKLLLTEKEKKAALKKASGMEKELTSKISSNIELGNKLDQAKTNLDNLKKEVAEEIKKVPDKEKTKEKTSLGDIHQALANFRKEVESE